jgi:cation transport protein ChaC
MLACVQPLCPDDIRASWVFAYGSLIWNPGFEYCRAELARLHGYHRSFCIGSTRYRGTPERPGVVLGLDRGGACIGVAYELAQSSREAALEELLRREIPNWAERVYRPTTVRIRLASGEPVQALTFVAERASRWYRRLPDAELLVTLREAHGQRGPNRDYAINTWQALRARGVHDARLERLAQLVESAISDRETSVAPDQHGAG